MRHTDGSGHPRSQDRDRRTRSHSSQVQVDLAESCDIHGHRKNCHASILIDEYKKEPGSHHIRQFSLHHGSRNGRPNREGEPPLDWPIFGLLVEASSVTSMSRGWMTAFK